MMKALVLNAPHDITLEEPPLPSPVPGEATVKVSAVGICGSDYMHFMAVDRSGDPVSFLVTRFLAS